MGYEKDDQVYTVTVTEKNDDDNPAVVTIADQPKDDPIRFDIKKVDKETGETVQGDANLAGAQFTVKFYNNYYSDESKLPSQATRTWVLETKKLGTIIDYHLMKLVKFQEMISIQDLMVLQWFRTEQ